MRVVFFGSGPFGLPALETLLEASSVHPLLRVVTRPDRPRKRSSRPAPTPVRERASALGIPTEAPESANEPAFLDGLSRLEPDLFIVADYGEMLRQRLRAIPRIGAFNLHGSLLPRHRGAAPVAHAILAGDSLTGVTLFRIEKGLDSGPIVDRESVTIGPDETAGELESRLSAVAGAVLARNLDPLARGGFPEEPQDASEATLAPKLDKSQGAIEWRADAESISRRIRAMTPAPGAYSFLRSAARPPERLTLRRGRPGPEALAGVPLPPGAVETVGKDAFTVRCGRGSLDILELQREGKRPMDSAAFLRGRPVRPGDRFGPQEET